MKGSILPHIPVLLQNGEPVARFPGVCFGVDRVMHVIKIAVRAISALRGFVQTAFVGADIHNFQAEHDMRAAFGGFALPQAPALEVEETLPDAGRMDCRRFFRSEAGRGNFICLKTVSIQEKP